MIQYERPGPFDIESVFNQFVKEFGGELVNTLIPKSDKLNADYVFKNENIIAELKCFRKDMFTEEDDAERMQTLLKKWTAKGIFKDKKTIKQLMRYRQLPKECIHDLVQAVRKTIDRIVHHANKQIHETKKELNMLQASGLLLLCNDGNYFLNNIQFMDLICNIMMCKYMNSDIDGFVYFTVNQVTRSQEDELDHIIWIPSYRKDGDVLGNFVNNLGKDFMGNFYTNLTGITNSKKFVTEDLNAGLKHIKKLKYLPKHIAYNKKGNC